MLASTSRHANAANHALYTLEIPETSDYPFIILNFHSKQHELCQHYCFVIDIATTTSDLITKYLGFKAILHVSDNDCIHGYITTINSNYIILESPLHLLKLQSRCKTYRNVTIPELIENILIQSGWQKHDFELQLKSNFVYPRHSCLTQYNMTNLEFMEQHLFCWGFIYYFMQHKNFCKLIITDKLTISHVKNELLYCEPGGFSEGQSIAYALHMLFSVQPQQAQINHYDSQQLDKEHHLIAVNSSGAIPGHGIRYYYGEPYTSESQGRYLLLIRQQALDNQRHRITVKTNYRCLQPNDIIRIIGLADITDNPSGLFRIIAITHYGNQRHGNNSHNLMATPISSYYGKLTLISLIATFRPQYQPRFNYSYQVGFISSPTDNLIDLDTIGSYHVRYPFGQDNPIDETVPNVRLLQPNTSKQGGHHWPLHNGTQVLLGFINGDIDQPIILGALANTAMPSPVTSHNPNQYILRSFSGNQLLLDDNSLSAHIKLNTPNCMQSVLFDANPQLPQLVLNAQQGNIQLSASAGLTLKTNSHHRQEIARNQYIKVTHANQLQTQQGDINISVAKNANLSAKNRITLTSINKNIHLQSNKNISISAKNNITWQVKNGASIMNDKGPLRLQGKKIHISAHGRGNIIITQGAGKITIHKTGNIHVHSQHIQIKGKLAPITPKKILLPVAIPAIPTRLPLSKVKLWLRLNYIINQETIPAISQAYAGINDKSAISYSDHTNSTGLGMLSQENNASFKKLYITNSEILSINSRNIANPSDTVAMSTADAIINSKINSDNIRIGDKIIDIGLIFPPVIINLRQDNNDKFARDKLSSEELEYFKRNGNNATLFIHGFNLPYGMFSKQILDFDYTEAPKRSTSDQTIYCDEAILKQRFPALSNFNYVDYYNGTGAHNWFIHMEDNLNCATKQFNRTHYAKYTRLINVAWSGDVAVVNYLDAEDIANDAGHKLVPLLMQLHEANITVFVIAHSLGNRVLLTAMNDLGKAGKSNLLERVFLWQPAVPNTALSINPAHDWTIKQNSKFIYAYQAAKKITVLFSNNDEVLHIAYELANEAGTSIKGFFSKQSWHDRHVYLQNVHMGKASIQKPIAMGLHGPDAATINFLDSRLELVNQSSWLFGHSEMKIPSSQLIEQVYKAKIWQADGYCFGKYVK